MDNTIGAQDHLFDVRCIGDHGDDNIRVPCHLRGTGAGRRPVQDQRHVVRAGQRGEALHLLGLPTGLAAEGRDGDLAEVLGPGHRGAARGEADRYYQTIEHGTYGGTLLDGVLFGYAFNVTRCEGYMECVAACVKENNLDRKSNTQYIRIFEMEHGQMSPESGDGKYFHEVPVEDHFYMGVQCFHCNNAPCVKACPTKATFKRESDGIVLMDFHRCIGCRFCMAACPYGSRSFNFRDPRPFIDEKEMNTQFPTRTKGVVEKCNFCAERLAEGKMPACVEASDGAIVFGDLKDPHSEVREVLREHFTLRRKQNLGTEPCVYYIV